MVCIKVISALDNQHVQDSLKKSFPELEFLLPDLSYQEGVLEALQSNMPDALLVSLDIEGDLEDKAFIEALRSINDTVKIVLIEKSENKEFNNWLISKGIFDTFIDGQCTFDDIYEALCREQKVIVKKEVRVEKEIVEKEKIVVKKQVIKEPVPVIFKRLVISVLSNTEFACELAYNIAKMARCRVLLLNLDFLSGHVDIYFNLSDNQPEQNTASPTDGSMLDSCIMVEDSLYLLTGPTGYEVLEKCRSTDYSTLVESCYREFDLTVISMGLPIEEFAASILQRSDFCILPNCTNTVKVKEAKELLEHVGRKYSIPADKFSFLAFEYKKGVNLPSTILKRIYGKSFMGCIPYDPAREAYRDHEDKTGFYARYAFHRNRRAYQNILMHMRIPFRTGFWESFTSFFKGSVKVSC